MWHPFRELRDTPDLLMVLTDDLPSGNAWWSPRYDVLYLRQGAMQVQRRCAVAHELAHRTLGHSGQCVEAPDGWRMHRRDEREADLWAARKLITLEDLARVLRWTDDPDEAADELWVTRKILDVRLARMYGGERRRVGVLLRQDRDEETG